MVGETLQFCLLLPSYQGTVTVGVGQSQVRNVENAVDSNAQTSSWDERSFRYDRIIKICITFYPIYLL